MNKVSFLPFLISWEDNPIFFKAAWKVSVGWSVSCLQQDQLKMVFGLAVPPTPRTALLVPHPYSP